MTTIVELQKLKQPIFICVTTNEMEAQVNKMQGQQREKVDGCN